MSGPRRWVPFAYGFRPLFLLAGLAGALGMLAWLWMYQRGLQPLSALPPQLWHAHEMLYGFIGAAVAGFMLTAVPSWTGGRGFSGWPLVLLTMLWLGGRVVFASASGLPMAVVAFGELSFIPVLMLLLAPALLRATNRNTPLLLVLAAFWGSDAVFIAGIVSDDPALCSAALRAGLGVVLVLISVIGGRIVPAFTGNALRQRGLNARMVSRPWLNRLAIGLTAAFALGDTFAPNTSGTGVIAALAGLAHAWRLAGWQGVRTTGQPIVWILHAGYLWLPTGLLLKAVFVFAGSTWAMHWQHALGAGAAGTMIMAVMTRAALGHTGRPLTVAPAITVAYIALLFAVLARVFGSSLLPGQYSAVVTIAGLLWSLAYAIFLVVYAPVLVRPRVDGKPG